MNLVNFKDKVYDTFSFQNILPKINVSPGGRRWQDMKLPAWKDKTHARAQHGTACNLGVQAQHASAMGLPAPAASPCLQT